MTRWERVLHWVAPLLAVAATFLLPALQASAPLLPTAQWTVGALAAEALHAVAAPAGRSQQRPELRSLLHQAQVLRGEFGGAPSSQSRRLEWALALAALIPVMAIVAGLCGLLSLALQAWGGRRWLATVAGIGLVATGYAVGASWWLTRIAHSELAQFFARAQHRFGGLLGGLDWKSLQAGLVAPLGLVPQVGLYLLFLAFLAMLVLPEEAALAVGEP